MIRRIFIDLDDVLNSCTMEILRFIGCDVGPYDYNKFNSNWGFDIVKAANSLHPSRKFSAHDLWCEISRSEWASMCKSEECDWLLHKCIDIVGEKNVCILTCPTFRPDSAAGKIEWIYKNLPLIFRQQFLIGLPKYMCACSGALLIDDKYQNVVEFRKAGGQAIVVPRPWNLYHGVDTKKYLNSVLPIINLKNVKF